MISRLALLALVWIILACAGPSRLEQGPSLCLVRGLTAQECPGCGLTRSFAHLARLQPIAATERHPLSLPIAAAGLFLWLRPAAQRRRRKS